MSKNLLICCAIAAVAASPAVAAPRLAIGIVPFDVATVQGGSAASGEVVAKLVRIEMIKNVKLQPVLLPAGRGGSGLPPDAQTQDVVLVGTVLAADTTSSSRDANTGSILGSGIGVGGRITRVTTHVELHLELVNPATGNLVDAFEVDAKSSGTKLGTDLSTALGSFDTGGTAFDNSSVGKAFREAAQRIAAEVAKRADKLRIH